MSEMTGIDEVKISQGNDECYNNAMHSKITFLLTLLR